MLLKGEATILLEANNQLINLMAGDYLMIPAHTRHRVEWTLPNFDTIWLAIHMK
jgi:cupin 2 domain-containing protein